MNADQFLDDIADDSPDEEVKRFAEGIARHTARLLMEGAYRITPEHAAELATSYPPGWEETRWLGGRGVVNPLVIETRILTGGHLALCLRLANGEMMWRATLRP